MDVVKTTARIGVTGLLAVVFVWPASGQVPGEVESLGWCPAADDCLSWTSVSGADAYALYRGDLSGVGGLPTAQAGPCLAGTFASTTSGPLPDAVSPATGRWYLVTATNPSGEGSAGSGSDGPRLVGPTGSCGQPLAGVVVNEVDYDQPGADTAEFVELKNAGADPVDLTGLAVVFVNGSNGSEYGRIDLGKAGSLSPGGYLVVGAAAVLGALPAGVPGLPLPTALQNGAPDGVVLVDVSAGRVIDALSYEGEIRAASIDGLDGPVDLVEGTALAAADGGAGSLIRFPDGADSDDASADWILSATPSPGAANVE